MDAFQNLSSRFLDVIHRLRQHFDIAAVELDVIRTVLKRSFLVLLDSPADFLPRMESLNNPSFWELLVDQDAIIEIVPREPSHHVEELFQPIAFTIRVGYRVAATENRPTKLRTSNYNTQPVYCYVATSYY